ncbi:response regulator [Lacihabitans soyangensis]|uniref:Response regulator n=1 Tax=Lacihabitans soyangensis TaxID=869394 RepID=A0AAE3H6W0_9BACT|nr:response regulator [Lacihabitans soyangensis]MCP9765962.1 response regulator [Lacihabitans soyangensis]
MKVLVVDDEEDIQDLFLQKFRKEIRNGEVEFSFATSGEKALVYLHQHESEAILILSDINMPGMSGIELLREIVEKNTKPKPIVMMITAYGDDETRNKALSLGADDFLNKPLDFGDLKERLFKR